MERLQGSRLPVAIAHRAPGRSLWRAAPADTFPTYTYESVPSAPGAVVRLPLLAMFAGLVLAAGCVSGAHSRLRPVVRDQSKLQADELMSLGPNASMYEVIERLRHRWLEQRAVDPAVPEAADQIGVYAGDHVLGGIGQLRYILARNVNAARFIGGREAAALYGPGHANGVIVLDLKFGG
jgi:hypothetical protein